MDRNCSDSAAIRRWKCGQWGFFPLTRVAPGTSGFFLYTALFKWFETVFSAMFSSGTVKTVLTWRSNLTISVILSIFSTIGLTEPVEEESTKPELQVTGCYSTGSINWPGLRLACVFAFIEKTVKYGYFLIAGAHLWHVLKQYWVKQLQNSLICFVITKSLFNLI